MRDRVPGPGKENRVRITQDDGHIVEGVLSYADDATQEGSAYTKGNVLPDDVCSLLELEHDQAEPKDAFSILGLINADIYGRISITVVNSESDPIPGVTFMIDTNSLVTDINGTAFIDLPPGAHTARFTGALDISFPTSTLAVQAVRGQISKYTVQANTYSGNQRTITTSGTYVFSESVQDFDVFAVGGGGSGAAMCYIGNTKYVDSAGTDGGAGGYTQTLLNQTNSGEDIEITIGAGGTAAKASLQGDDFNGGALYETAAGNKGGTTIVKKGSSVILTAEGGDGAGAPRHSTSASGVQGDCASGGSGGGAAVARPSSSSNPSYGARPGNGGTNGGGGEKYNWSSKQYEEMENSGQQRATTAFEENTGTGYSPGGGSAAAATTSSTSSVSNYSGNGNVKTGATGYLNCTASVGGTYGGGGGAALCFSTMEDDSSSDAYSMNATSGAGASGLVILRWRYKT
ncbi:MAG: hypothetical protein KH195_00015 [Clostridiaceae bacterium]|nr:hypothetical protein [Clostridiaceae bacterium]